MMGNVGRCQCQRIVHQSSKLMALIEDSQSFCRNWNLWFWSQQDMSKEEGWWTLLIKSFCFDLFQGILPLLNVKDWYATSSSKDILLQYKHTVQHFYAFPWETPATINQNYRSQQWKSQKLKQNFPLVHVYEKEKEM
jgi:hypothetical protein